MKLLYLLDFPPFKEDFDGITKIYFNLIKHVSKRIDVDILVVSRGVNDNSVRYRGVDFPKVDTFFSVKNIYYEHVHFSNIKKNINRLKFEYATSLNKNDTKKLDVKYDFKKYDVIHTAHLSFLNTCHFHNKVIIGATDAATLAMPAKSLKDKFRKFYFKRIENKISKNLLHIHAVTKRDADGYNSDRVFVITNGVDTDKYKKIDIDKIKNSFVFHGNLEYQPNIDAIFNMSKVLQNIVPANKLYIVGRGKTDVYKVLNNIIIVGEVDNIVQEICKYEYYLILMTTGTGVKNKLLEAMSSECNIIANDLAINGLMDRSFLLESINLIENNKEIINILKINTTKNARKYVIENYSWEGFSEQFINVYKRV